MKDRYYIAIDLKSFYASVECVERGLDPLTTNLVVADIGRTEKTICLAVSPSLKAYGIPGRPRLFEVVQKVREINATRMRFAPGRAFTGTSFSDPELKSSPHIALDYIAARPRMALYIEYSTRIYNIYLKYIAPEDIHVYSVDEVFIDATDYLAARHLSVRELAAEMLRDVLDTTGITATAGIGTKETAKSSEIDDLSMVGLTRQISDNSAFSHPAGNSPSTIKPYSPNHLHRIPGKRLIG